MAATDGGVRMYGAWMWHKSAENNKWIAVWGVLKDRTLFFFSSDQTTLENHIGTLHLTTDCKLHCARDGNTNEGFKFELQMDKKKKTKFKVKTLYEREIWKAYLQGVITGHLPHDVILSPQDLQDITYKLQQLQQRLQQQQQTPGVVHHSQSAPYFPGPQTPPNHPGHPPYNHSQSQPDFSDRVSMSPSQGSQNTQKSEKSRRPSVGSRKTEKSSGGSSSGGEFDPPAPLGGDVNRFSRRSPSGDSGLDFNEGGPFMNHRFDAGEREIPPWFFHECSRELAERILTACPQQGNTLMRVSTTARPTGSYAISKRLERSEGKMTQQVQHYEVIRVAEGYKINVDNAPHPAMKSLSEVMQFFIELSGVATTFPMTSNNLKDLGIDYTEYVRRIPVQDYEIPKTHAPPPPNMPPIPPIPQAPFAHVFPTSPPSSQPAGFNTGFRDRSGSDSRPPQRSPIDGRQNQTMGPADWRQNTRPSVQQLHQEQSALKSLDDLNDALNREELRSLTLNRARQFADKGDKPPPLPDIKNRPKLDEFGRPILLNNKVPAAPSPPDMVSPAGDGAKVPPPPTAPKNTPPVLRQPTIPEDKSERPVSGPGPSVMDELQGKLQKWRMQAEKDQPANDKPSLPQTLESHEENEQLYEPLDNMYQNLNQEYQNCGK